ncbi:dual specificity protein phosphatase family protein [Sorangium sp. So ce315]|uniref:dual specificity protein phosphatase family protein n=1 Tax=Sorangium sp. So ce315 TaxID=3133299 RepID=UPI003F626F8C
MRYGLTFLALSAALAALAVLAGGAALVLLWPAMSFGLVGAAYLARRPALLGKRPDGTQAAWALVLLGPYFLLTWATWRAERALGRADCANEVVPGLWVGRRPLGDELPAGVRLVVDMTAEFPAAAAVRRHPGYLCVPTLDGTGPEVERLRELIERLRGVDGVYLHCASGRGRSATLAIALLLERGLAADVDEVEAQLRQRRPGIQLNAAQRELLRRARARPGA